MTRSQRLIHLGFALLILLLIVLTGCANEPSIQLTPPTTGRLLGVHPSQYIPQAPIAAYDDGEVGVTCYVYRDKMQCLHWGSGGEDVSFRNKPQWASVTP